MKRYWWPAAAFLAAGLVAPAGAGGAVTARATADRPDQDAPFQVHVVYFVPRDGRDLRLDANGTLHAAVVRMQSWFRAASGGLTWRVDTYGPRRITDVTFVRGRRTNAEYKAGTSVLDQVGTELRATGMSVERTNKRYLVFYGGDTSDSALCGIADYPVYSATAYTPARTGVLLGGDFAMVFLGAPGECRPRDFGTGTMPGWVQTSMMHELVHTEGLTPPGAPHTCDPTAVASAGHVCGLGAGSVAGGTVTEPLDPERTDLMFPYVNLPLSAKALDRGSDDYVRSPTATIDLAESAFVVGGRPGGGPSILPARLVRVADPAE